ncbi:flagellar filament capping protein FliD [Desemzia sp. C1]|uniref:flagellar filament capping protein FliD n=1 Tax=Desemzia sp. C1 TaxID=2892016 RepID=UPI001E485465|nr:flagellar filament capping protein FliD [Desemzia sp. C1]MCI3028104.1 flagellar filament capping protein FliD [Desemzia sp. C1]
MTSSLSFMGSYSGITMDTVDQLIEAESRKVVQYKNQQTGLTGEKNAWKDINTRLDSLYKKFDALKEPNAFDSKTVSNTNDKAVKVTAGTEALEGSYKVEVTTLATSSQLTSGSITGMSGKKITDSLSLSGELTFTTENSKGTEENKDLDTKSFTIKIAEGDSLKDIVTKINETAKEKESGLHASVIDNRIVLTDTDMGERSISVTDSNLEEGNESLVGKLALGTDVTSFTSGKQANLTVNGIQMYRNSNTITDAVDGLTFNLVGVTESNQVSTVKVTEDVDKTTKAIQDFVDQYNSVMSFIDTQLDVGDPSADGNKTGALVGDSSLMRIQSQLRSMMTSSSKDSTQPIKGLSDLGIEVNRFGAATLDTAKLKEQLAKNSNNVQAFFFREESVKDADRNETTKQFGIAQQMTTFINEYIGEKTGIITTKSKTIDGMIKGLDEQITKFNERLEKKRERYIEQFTALDVAMMEAESQLSYLMSQVTTNQQK